MAKSNVVIDISTNGAAKSEQDLKKVSKATDDVAKSQEAAAKSSDQMAEGFEAADGAMGGMLSQLKALATNPYAMIIAAIVGALAALKSALTSSAAGQAQWTKAMDRIGSVVRVVADFIGKVLVESIDKAGGLFNWLKDGVVKFLEVAFYPMIKAFKIMQKLMTGDFSGAGDELIGVLDDIAGAANTVVDTFNSVVKGVKDLTKAIQEADKIQQEISDRQEANRKARNAALIEEAKINRLLEEQKLILADGNKPWEERAEAIKKAQGYTSDLLNTKNKVNEADIAIMELQRKQGAFNQEQEAEWAQLMANRQMIMGEVAQKRSEFASQEAALINEVKAARVAEWSDFQMMESAKLEVATVNVTKLATMKQVEANTDVELTKLTTEQKQEVATQAMGNAASLMKEGTKAQKAMLIAQATMETYKGATSAFSSLAGIAIVGPALGALAAAAAIAAGLKNIQAIAKAGGGGGGGASSGGGVSMPSTPRQVFEAPKATIDNNNQSVKAYIVEDDLAANNKKQANQKEISSL